MTLQPTGTVGLGGAVADAITVNLARVAAVAAPVDHAAAADSVVAAIRACMSVRYL